MPFRVHVKLYEKLTRVFPPQLGAWLDYQLRPTLRKSFGGPFNGQLRRKEIFEELLKTCDLQAIIETGTYLGTSTAYFNNSSQLPIYSSEINPRFYFFSRYRFQGNKKVFLHLADSRFFLTDLVKRMPIRSRVFFYLDAHWGTDLPLREELEIIQNHFHESVIMIDDFQVPDDPGYGFDDYGEGKILNSSLLTGLSFHPFWPAASSDQETGHKRGCIVLTTNDAIKAVLLNMKTLRHF